MVVKTVTLTKEAYDSLSALKNEGESFSEVVRRLTGSQVMLSSFAGVWAGAPKAEIRKIRGFLKASDRLSRQKLGRLARVKVGDGQPR
jgi:predicted CopG family antitoxin